MSAITTAPLTAIVPARNEQNNIEAAVRSLAAQPEIAEIRVVNDGSSDRTAEILARMAGEFPRLRVIDAGPLPSGWVGKNHAAWLGAQNVATDWFLFTDADVRHLPGSAAHALALAAQYDASLVSFSPRQRIETWWERAIIPFVFLRLAKHFSFDRVNDPQQLDAAANGQYLVIRAAAYLAAGGHRAVSSEVLEDVALARRLKASGHRLYFGPGDAVAETRMYLTFPAMWQGWTKNLYPLMGGAPAAVSRELASVTPLGALAFFILAFLYPVAALGGAAFLAAHLFRYLRDLRRNRFSASGIVYWGPGLVLYAAALVASAYRYSAGSVAWKGRTYPARL